MNISEIPVSEISLEDSPYRLNRLFQWGEIKVDHAPLEAAFQALGVLQPLLVKKVSGQYHLVDGFKRLAFLIENKASLVSCAVLLEGSANDGCCNVNVFNIALHESGLNRESRFIDKLRCVTSAIQSGVSREQVLEIFLPALGLGAHDRVLRRLENIAKLPDGVLDFCTEKNFSMKQCYHLTRHPPGVVDLVFSWRQQLFLTAAVVNELCESLKDHLRAHELTIDEFRQDDEVLSLLGSNLSPQEKTAQLRKLVHLRRYPLLTKINQEMVESKASMKLPTQVSLVWDSTLENRELKMMFVVKEPEEWQQVVKRLQSDQVNQGIQKLFEHL